LRPRSEQWVKPLPSATNRLSRPPSSLPSDWLQQRFQEVILGCSQPGSNGYLLLANLVAAILADVAFIVLEQKVYFGLF
jgi:hypothetical protein